MRLLDIVTAAWAIMPEKLEEIQAIYATHLRGDKIDVKALEAKMGRPLENPDQGYQVVNGVAVVPMFGVMAKRMNMFSQISGGMSTELVARDLRAAAADPSVRGIIMEIDSPGGTVDGTPELGAVIRSVAQQKPTVAFVSGAMASAAYWAGSAAPQVFISSGVNIVGAIGVIAKHMDTSRAEEARGVKTTLIYAGKYKALGNEYAPLSEEGRAEMQARVDYLYSQFVGAVAQHRGVPVSTVLERMADGKVFVGEQAIEAGLVDGVSTLEDLIAVLSEGTLPVAAKASAIRGQLIAATAATYGAGAALEPTLHEESIMDITKLRAEHPALVEALVKEGRDSVDVAASRAEAALKERTRIQAIHALAAPGHDKLIADAMFDGTSTAGDVAQKIVIADRDARGAALNGLRQDGSQPAAVRAGPANLPAVQDTATLPVDERCKAKWESDAAIRNDFTSVEAYTAYVKAAEAGNFRVLGQTRAA